MAIICSICTHDKFTKWTIAKPGAIHELSQARDLSKEELL